LNSPKESKREVVQGHRPRHLINLSPGTQHTRVSESTTSFAYYTHKLHKQTITSIQKRNANYKAYADLYKRVRDFNVGVYMMVRSRPKQYPSGIVKKLHGPFKILRRINSNGYIVDL